MTAHQVMFKSFASIVVLLFLQACKSQDDSKSELLVGSKVLPCDENYLIDKSPNSQSLEFGIVSSTSVSDTLIIEVKVEENCCADFVIDAKVNDNEELELFYSTTGELCTCRCCYGLQYVLYSDFYKLTDLSIVLIDQGYSEN